jgi:hypothetical protein
VHLDLKAIGNRARHKLPLDRNLAKVLVGNLGEHVRAHVEMVLVTTSLVGDLFPTRQSDFGESVAHFTHHGNLLGTSLVRDGNTATAVLAIVPDSLGDTTGAQNRRGKDVVGKGTGALLPAGLLTTALAIPGTLTRVDRGFTNLHIGGSGWSSKSKGGESQSDQRGGRRSEQHLE